MPSPLNPHAETAISGEIQDRCRVELADAPRLAECLRLYREMELERLGETPV